MALKDLKKKGVERSTSNASDSGFWTTIDLLIGREWRDRTGGEGSDEGDLGTLAVARRTIRRPRKGTKSVDPLDDVFSDDALSIGGSILQSRLLSSPALPGSSAAARITDKAYMSHLQHSLREDNEEALQQRIAAREMKEMDRLKRLILSGRSPLKDCPPELRGHPVFVFWRLVNKEVEKMSKARADAYYRNLRRLRRSSARDDQPSPASESEIISLASCPENDDPGSSEDDKEAAGSQKNDSPEEQGDRMPLRGGSFKYEDEGIKELRELTTVEELYQMADQIVGIPKDADTNR